MSAPGTFHSTDAVTKFLYREYERLKQEEKELREKMDRSKSKKNTLKTQKEERMAYLVTLDQYGTQKSQELESLRNRVAIRLNDLREREQEDEARRSLQPPETEGSLTMIQQLEQTVREEPAGRPAAVFEQPKSRDPKSFPNEELMNKEMMDAIDLDVNLMAQKQNPEEREYTIKKKGIPLAKITGKADQSLLEMQVSSMNSQFPTSDDLADNNSSIALSNLTEMDLPRIRAQAPAQAKTGVAAGATENKEEVKTMEKPLSTGIRPSREPNSNSEREEPVPLADPPESSGVQIKEEANPEPSLKDLMRRGECYQKFEVSQIPIFVDLGLADMKRDQDFEEQRTMMDRFRISSEVDLSNNSQESKLLTFLDQTATRGATLPFDESPSSFMNSIDSYHRCHEESHVVAQDLDKTLPHEDLPILSSPPKKEKETPDGRLLPKIQPLPRTADDPHDLNEASVDSKLLTSDEPTQSMQHEEIILGDALQNHQISQETSQASQQNESNMLNQTEPMFNYSKAEPPQTITKKSSDEDIIVGSDNEESQSDLSEEAEDY